jgi:hypothetical protein
VVNVEMVEGRFEKDFESYTQRLGIQCEGNKEPQKVFEHGIDRQTIIKHNTLYTACSFCHNK